MSISVKRAIAMCQEAGMHYEIKNNRLHMWLSEDLKARGICPEIVNNMLLLSERNLRGAFAMMRRTPRGTY